MSEKTIKRDTIKFKAFIRDYWMYYRELEDELLSKQIKEYGFKPFK